MEAHVKLPESESPAQLNSSSAGLLTNRSVEFLPLGPENLIRLGEDLLHTFPIFQPDERRIPNEDKEHISSISNLVSRNRISPTDLPSEEAAALAETFCKVPFPS